MTPVRLASEVGRAKSNIENPPRVNIPKLESRRSRGADSEAGR